MGSVHISLRCPLWNEVGQQHWEAICSHFPMQKDWKPGAPLEAGTPVRSGCQLGPYLLSCVLCPEYFLLLTSEMRCSVVLRRKAEGAEQREKARNGGPQSMSLRQLDLS